MTWDIDYESPTVKTAWDKYVRLRRETEEALDKYRFLLRHDLNSLIILEKLKDPR